MVAHKWAHGNSGKGSNFHSPDGKRLISYGTDVAYNTGRGLIFISTNSMSPSTGKQLSCARRACNHLDVISTPIFRYGSRLYDFDENRAFKTACEALSVQLEGYSKVRLGKYLHNSMVQTEVALAGLEVLAGKYGFEMPAVYRISDERREAVRVYAEQWQVKDRARRETARIKEHARQAAQRENDRAQFDGWRLFESGARCPASYRRDAGGGYYIAVHGDKVVTSGGAECPTEHARRGIEFWLSRKFDGATCPVCWKAATLETCDHEGAFVPWARNGHRVQLGTFQLDRIEADGTAYAGCHKFSLAELDRLASILL
jgi:hypothetical protein